MHTRRRPLIVQQAATLLRTLAARVLPALLITALLLPSLGAHRAWAADGPDAIQIGDAGLKVFIPTLSKRCSFSATPNVFGVQMYGATGAATNYYDSLVDSGADWVRVPIEWRDVEPDNRAPANYRWQSADAAIAAAADGCKNLVVTLRSAPDWAATYPQSRIDKAPLSEFAQFVSAVVERYDGDGNADAPGSPLVTYWELYNEPDASEHVPGHEGWGEYGKEYAQMLAVAYDAIKAANTNPNVRVLFGGIAYDWFWDDGGNFIEEFLDDVLKAGGGEHFDIMNIHSYPGFGATWIQEVDPSCVKTKSCNGPGLLEKVIYIRAKLAGYNVGDKPIMITESGWHSDNPPAQPSSPEVQARYVTELYTQSKAASVLNTIYFALTDSGIDYPYANGLVTTDSPPQRKKAFTAYQVAVDWLASAQFVRRLPVTELKAKEMDAYQFYHSGRGHTFYVAWLNPVTMGLDLDGNGTPEVAENLESLRLPGATANVYNIYGKLLNTVSDTDGDVKILIGGQPRIIEMVK